jgi:hypothetical protein
MKTFTREQLQKRKERAARFAREVREDDELADRIENESLEEYAEHRRIRTANPAPRRSRPLPDRVLRERRSKPMPVQTRRELQERIEELETENEELQDRLDQISDLAISEEDESGNE